MRDYKIVFPGSEQGIDRRINRRHFLKAGVALWGGILSGGFVKIADAAMPGRKRAVVEAIVIGVHSDVSTEACFSKPILPGLRIASGDTVTIGTDLCHEGMTTEGDRLMGWTAAYKKDMAARPDVYFPPDHVAGSMRKEKSSNQICFACPIDVEGAEFGDILQVEILEIIPNGLAERGTEWFRTELGNDAFGSLPLVKILAGKDLEVFDPVRLNMAKAFYMPIRRKGDRIIAGGFLFEENQGEVGLGASGKGCRSFTLRITVRKDLKAADLPVSTSNHWAVLGIRSDLLSCCKAAEIMSIRLQKVKCGMFDKPEYVFCNMRTNHHVSQYVNRQAILTHIRV